MTAATTGVRVTLSTTFPVRVKVGTSWADAPGAVVTAALRHSIVK